MEQNQTVDNDLQKAIDDITKTTSVDPVFSDPVAAPSSVPEGDTGEMGEPNGPFPEPKIETPAISTTHAPAFDAPPAPEIPEAPVIPDMPMPEMPPTPEPAVESENPPIIKAPEVDTTPQSLTTGEVKKAALRDLIPLLDKINMDPSQKFDIYRDIFESLKDYTILDPAYHAAREIPDELERAEALLSLVQSIDKM